MASKGDVDAVLRTLKDGGVDVDARGGWREFARELVARACGKSSGAKASTASGASGGKTVTESDMRKKAASYSLLDMQDDVPIGKFS